jgi:hypothetical protein
MGGGWGIGGQGGRMGYWGRKKANMSDRIGCRNRDEKVLV